MARSVLIDYPSFFGTPKFWIEAHESDGIVILDAERYSMDRCEYNGNKIPVAMPPDRVFSLIRICNFDSWWQERMWKSIYDQYHASPFFDTFKDEIKRVLCGRYYCNLSDFFLDMFTCLYNILDLNTPVLMETSIPFMHEHFTDRIINIAKYVCSSVVNLPGYLRNDIQKVKFKWQKMKLNFFYDYRNDMLEMLFAKGNDVRKWYE
ncbi:MAG: hypothetical protein DRI44_02645 [Chlamydiae bacterium]|nr:MAG: hypothetical protein DRI44_02645 [Chlamydiota bacterium]